MTHELTHELTHGNRMVRRTVIGVLLGETAGPPVGRWATRFREERPAADRMETNPGRSWAEPEHVGGLLVDKRPGMRGFAIADILERVSTLWTRTFKVTSL